MQVLKQIAYLRPMTGRRRVFIIEEAENMNDDAANSLLKVLEEPPDFSHIILVTANPFRLLPTIRSRCQTLTFSSIGHEEIEEISARAGFQPGAGPYPRPPRRRQPGAGPGARLGRGPGPQATRPGDSSRRSIPPANEPVPGALRPVPKAVQEELGRVLELFASFGRDILLLRLGGDPALLLNPDFEERLREASPAWSTRRLLGVRRARCPSFPAWRQSEQRPAGDNLFFQFRG